MSNMDFWLARELARERARDVQRRSEAQHRLRQATLLRHMTLLRRRVSPGLHRRLLHRLGVCLMALGERLYRYGSPNALPFEGTQSN